MGFKTIKTRPTKGITLSHKQIKETAAMIPTMSDLHEVAGLVATREGKGIVLVHADAPDGDSAEGGLKISIPSENQAVMTRCLVHILAEQIIPRLQQRAQELEVGNVENN